MHLARELNATNARYTRQKWRDECHANRAFGVRTRAPYAVAHSGTEWPNAAAWQLERMKDGSVRIVESWNKRGTKFAWFLRSGGEGSLGLLGHCAGADVDVCVGINNRLKTVEKGFNLRKKTQKIYHLHDVKRRYGLLFGMMIIQKKNKRTEISGNILIHA